MRNAENKKGRAMSKWIDADKLKIPSEEMVARMIINSAPSIDIVRCKECVLRKKKYLCQVTETDADDFCSRGKRKTNEQMD